MEESILVEQRRVCFEHLTHRRALREVGMQAYWDVVSVRGIKYLLSFAPLPPLLCLKAEDSSERLRLIQKSSRVLTEVHLCISALLERKAEQH